MEPRTDTTGEGHGTPAERRARARRFFGAEDRTGAARVRSSPVEETPDRPRLPPARVSSRSARLRRIDAESRVIVDRDPVRRFARLVLGRTLERQARHGGPRPPADRLGPGGGLRQAVSAARPGPYRAGRGGATGPR